MSETKRVVVTGMAINTPLGDTLDGFLEALLAGRSAITRWKQFDTSRVYTKIGGDLSEYDLAARVASLQKHIPPETYKRLRRLVNKVPWSIGLTLLLALEGYRDAGLFDAELDPMQIAAVVAGHNINSQYQRVIHEQFDEEPEYMDPLAAIHSLDTCHPSCVSELLGIRGPIYTVGGACASGNIGLRSAVDEIRYHGMDTVLLVGAALEFSLIELQGMALIGAASIQSFNDTPELASRPFDVRREGFVPSHGGAVLVLEELEHARRRGARIYAEVIGVEAGADASHLPQPNAEGQAHLTTHLLDRCKLLPEQIDFISAHATSTPQGDLAEIQGIAQAFGTHSRKLKINAPKSMLGHTCWSAPVVETVAAILQMNASRLHPSINIDSLDPAINLDVCAGGAVHHEVRYFMKNSFGFGGINCISIFKRYEA